MQVSNSYPNKCYSLLTFCIYKKHPAKVENFRRGTGLSPGGGKTKPLDKYKHNKETSKMTQISGDKPTDTGGKADLARGKMWKKLCPNQILRANSWEAEKAVRGRGRDFLSLWGQET